MPEAAAPARVSLSFDPACRQCSRLASYLAASKAKYPHYHCAPVAPFGDPDARLLVVGLAPGLHGANASGRPFTGDFAGILLYRTLFDFGFSTAAQSASRDDALRLVDCRLTNAVKCVPPENKPVGAEINNCNAFLREELAAGQLRLIIALGGIAHNAILKALGYVQSAYRFGHDQLHELPDGLLLLDSYHCSRYNTQTKRLTEPMFRAVFERARTLLQK